MDESRRLLALNAATSTRAETNLAVLAALEAARAAYRPSLRAEEITARLAPGLVEDADDVRTVLDALADWGCVAHAFDRSHRRVARLADFYREQLVWQITPVGRAVVEAARAVLTAFEAVGGLRRRIFGELRRRLQELEVAAGAGDANAAYVVLRALSVDLDELTRSAQDFRAKLQQLADQADVDPGEFSAVKRVLVEYLSNFSQDLYLHRGELERRVDAVERLGCVATLAAAGDDSADAVLDTTGGRPQLERTWRARWEAMRAWIVGAPDVASGIAELTDALTDATTTILTHVRRLADAGQRRISRAGELVELAAWFARCTDDEAHRLFDAAIGLGQAPRVQTPSPDVVGRARPGWFEGPTVDLVAVVRPVGASNVTGRVGRVVDFSAELDAMAAEARGAALRRRAAARVLAAGLDGAVLPADAFDLLLVGVSRALNASGIGSAVVEGIVVEVAPDPAGTEIGTERGRLSMPGLAVSVHAPPEGRSSDAHRGPGARLRARRPPASGARPARHRARHRSVARPGAAAAGAPVRGCAAGRALAALRLDRSGRRPRGPGRAHPARARRPAGPSPHREGRFERPAGVRAPRLRDGVPGPRRDRVRKVPRRRSGGSSTASSGPDPTGPTSSSTSPTSPTGVRSSPRSCGSSRSACSARTTTPTRSGSSTTPRPTRCTASTTTSPARSSPPAPGDSTPTRASRRSSPGSRRPGRRPSHASGSPGAWSSNPPCTREARRHRAPRARRPALELSERLERLTGCQVEARAEGVALVDPDSSVRLGASPPFPGNSNAGNIAAIWLAALRDTRTDVIDVEPPVGVSVDAGTVDATWSRTLDTYRSSLAGKWRADEEGLRRRR
ncbi:MAG: TIGR02677 family protein [Acidimicrobiia bacterium]|nr:TIGR02677 family protein [Acidimicrobiia bacterium]